jgi:hypothetical protein
VLVAELGATGMSVGLTNLAGALQAHHSEVWDIVAGSEATLHRVEELFDQTIGAGGPAAGVGHWDRRARPRRTRLWPPGGAADHARLGRPPGPRPVADAGDPGPRVALISSLTHVTRR